ncbi:hypothetical protein REPUB_Repub11eG0078500 [Reevesia pubescens]
MWNSRNDEVHNQRNNTPLEVSIFARRFVEEFQQVQEKHDSIISAEVTEWQKPKVNFVKANFDGALNVDEGFGGTRVIIRDEYGLVVSACSRFHNGVWDPKVAECLAMLDAINLAKDMGFQRVIFEGDAAQVVRFLNKPGDDLSVVGNLIMERNQNLRFFLFTEVKHVKRSLNTAADILAKSALIAKSDLFWVEDIPYMIQHIVISECNSL